MHKDPSTLRSSEPHKEPSHRGPCTSHCGTEPPERHEQHLELQYWGQSLVMIGSYYDAGNQSQTE